MNKSEYLLACLAEEAGELAQACGKALRFGLNDGYPGTGRTNEDDILVEVAHVKAVAQMLDIHCRQSEGVLMDVKILKVKEFMEYAKKRGTLKESE